MSKDWRTIFRFANTGLAISAIYLVFHEVNVLANSWTAVWMFWSSLLLCPGLFAFDLLEAGGELPVQATALVWLAIGFGNYLYYIALGAIYVDLRARRGEPRPRLWFAKR